MALRRSAQGREIGPWGTAARLLVGTAMVVSVAVIGIGLPALVLGVVVLPGVVISAMLIRGRRDDPLRAHAPYWHCVNIGIGVIVFSISLPAALIFYGSSMIIAAVRGFGACELLAISNLVLRRNDQLACPLFLPVDAAEAKRSGRELYCS